MAIAAVGQICSTASMSHNLAQCQTLVRKAVSVGAKTLFLPEASDYIAGSSEQSAELVKSVQDSEFVQGLQYEARFSNISINVGVHEPTANGQKVKNTLLWIDEKGNIVQRYQKLHLFDVDVHNGPKLKESRSVEAGTEIVAPFETSLGRVGLAICFDIRFPELALSLRRQGAEILTYPSAFSVMTGRAHWEILLRARAIENQAWVIAAAQSGKHNEIRESYGHSMIIDPWGRVVASLGDQSGPALATAEIDLTKVKTTRNGMSLLRRTDVYPEI